VAAGGASIDVAFIPTELTRTQVAIVVDVLRASSTVVAALAAGYERVLCVDSVEAAWSLRSPGRALAGERGCRRIEGFDFGNSPGEIAPVSGGELVLCTTNGTPAIVAAAARADQVLVGSLLNLDALAAAIPGGVDVTVVCAGTDGRFALEDAYAAGRIVARLEGARSDAALAAERLAGAYGSPLVPLADSADAAVLKSTGQEADISYCAQESVLAGVPVVQSVRDGVALLCDSKGGTEIEAPSGVEQTPSRASDQSTTPYVTPLTFT